MNYSLSLPETLHQFKLKALLTGPLYSAKGKCRHQTRLAEHLSVDPLNGS